MTFSVTLLHPPISFDRYSYTVFVGWNSSRAGTEANGPCQEILSQVTIHIQPIILAVNAVNVPNAMGDRGDEPAAPEPVVIKHFHPKEGP